MLEYVGVSNNSYPTRRNCLIFMILFKNFPDKELTVANIISKLFPNYAKTEPKHLSTFAS